MTPRCQPQTPMLWSDSSTWSASGARQMRLPLPFPGDMPASAVVHCGAARGHSQAGHGPPSNGLMTCLHYRGGWGMLMAPGPSQRLIHCTQAGSPGLHSGSLAACLGSEDWMREVLGHPCRALGGLMCATSSNVHMSDRRATCVHCCLCHGGHRRVQRTRSSTCRLC